jgi:neutrophil factor 2
MTLSPEMSFKDFVRMLMKKFGCVNGLGLKFKDEDGGMVSLKDESDYELAIETAKENAKGRPEGKLEIWCTELIGRIRI